MKNTETVATGLERYPEFENAVNKIGADVFAMIAKEAGKIESDMPYKFQFLLEEVVKDLQNRI